MKTSRVALWAAVALCGGAAFWFLGGGTPTPPPKPADPRQARAFHGSVKDQRGARLAGALVEATWIGADTEPVLAGSAATDSEGLYRFSIGLPATADGVVVLSATAPGHERAGRRVDPGTSRQDFVLSTSPARVTVLAKDERGTPVRSAQVTLSVEPEAGEPDSLLVLVGETRSGGVAVFEGIPGPAATLHWSVRAKDHAPGFGDLRKAWGNGPVLIEATLAKGVEVRGTVLEADGRGVGAADVILTQEMGPWSGKARTDGTGAFIVRDAPRGSQLVAQLESDGHVLADGQDEVRFSIPADAQSWELQLRAQPAGQLTGSVETSTGRGIVGAVVDAIPADGRMSRRKAAETDREGRFRVAGLRIDTEWKMEARHRDFAPGFIESARPSRSGGDIRIRLVAGGAIAGQVTSDEGAAMEGIEAYAHRISRSDQVVSGLREYATARSGQDGRYRVDHLNPGSYRVEVRPPARMAWSSIAAKVFEIDVREGETSTVRTVTLTRRGTLRARFVVGSAEAGDAFVELSFMQATATGAPHQVSVQRGSGGFAVVLGLEPGRYDVTARLERHGSATVQGIEIASGRVAEATFDFGVRAALTGTVQRPEGTPVPGAKVDVFSPRGGSQGRYSLPGRAADNFSGNHATTDAAGRYRVEGVERGAHVIRVTANGEAPAERNVQVGSGDTVANIVLSPPASAMIRVTGPDGKPLVSRIVVLESEPLRSAAGYSESMVTDADGIARFSGLPAGTHVARVVAGAQPRQSFDTRSGETSRVTVTVADAQDARRR